VAVVVAGIVPHTAVMGLVLLEAGTEPLQVALLLVKMP
jgi:hypothetical protein